MLIVLLILDILLLLGLAAYIAYGFWKNAKNNTQSKKQDEPIDYKYGVNAEDFMKELELAREQLNKEAGKEVVPATEEPVSEPVVEEVIPEEPVVEEPVIEEPIVEEPIVEEPIIEESIIEEPIIEEEPQLEITPILPEQELAVSQVEDEEDDREPVRRIPFCEKMLYIDRKTQEYYDTINNEFISFRKINPRVSMSGVSYRLGRELVAKVTVRGKTMRLNLALDVKDFEPNIYFQKDMSDVKAYQEVPFSVKVKSDRGLRNAIKLILAMAEKKEIVKKTRYERVESIEQLKAKALELR